MTAAKAGPFTPLAPPVPVVTRLDEHFWRGGVDGRLHIQRCCNCHRWLHPPTPACRFCASPDTRPEPVSGRGHVRTFTINHYPWFADIPLPYVLVIVALEEQPGLQFLSRLVGCPPDVVRVGLPVRVRFEPHGDVYLPLFAPDAPTDQQSG